MSNLVPVTNKQQNRETAQVILEESKFITNLLSLLLTLSNVVDQVTEDRNMDDSVAITPLEEWGYDTIELREMVTGLDNKTLDVSFLDSICSALVDSAMDGLKTYSELKPLESLFSHGINEILLFSLVIDETYEQESLSFLKELKNNIIECYTAAANDVTNYIIEHRIIDKYTYVEYSQYISGGIVIYCSNQKLKILEER